MLTVARATRFRFSRPVGESRAAIIACARWLCVTPVLAITFAACGDETPERAIYNLAHDLEHEDIAGVCERIFPSEEVPRQIAGTLSLESRATGRRGLTFDCRGAFAAEGSLRALEFHEPRVRSATVVPIRHSAGITGAAIAEVALDGAEPRSVPLVRTGGKWRLVVDARKGQLAGTAAD
jgi:hypothetical protein